MTEAARHASPNNPCPLPCGWQEALHQAVSAIYFDDSYDFKFALLNIIKAMAPDWMDELSDNPKAVFHKSRQLLVAAKGDASCLRHLAEQPLQMPETLQLKLLQQAAAARGFALVKLPA